LEKLGFKVLPSQANFILVRPPAMPAKNWLQRLRERKILVRWFSNPEVRDYIRITIGTDAETAALVGAAREILGGIRR
jgi:histidinol-phosphate aminotransferase